MRRWGWAVFFLQPFQAILPGAFQSAGRIILSLAYMSESQRYLPEKNAHSRGQLGFCGAAVQKVTSGPNQYKNKLF